MKNKSIALLLLLSMNVAYGEEPASAIPNKADAEKWLANFRAARDKTSDALFVNDAEKRAKLTPVIVELRDRAEKIFSDDFSVCISAAEYVNGYWMNENFLMMDPNHNTHIQLTGLLTLVWEGGQAYGTCRDLIDTIK